MSNNQRFDEYIKNQLDNYSPKVNSAIWDNIVKERDKRKPVGFWLNFLSSKNSKILAGVLILLFVGVWGLYKKNNTSSKTNNTNSNTQQLVSQLNKTSTTQNNNKKTSINKISNQLTVVSNIIDNGSSKINTNNFLNNSFSANNQQPDLVNNTSIFNEDKNNLTSSTNNINTNNADYAASFFLSPLNYFAEKNIVEKQSLTLQKNNFPNVILPDCPSIEKNAAGNKKYVEFYVGPDIAFRNLSDTGNSNYLQKRKQSTTFSSAFSAGVRYTKVFSNGISVRTGINFSQITEKFTFVQGNLVQVTYIINNNGDTTGSYVTTGTRYKTTYNKFNTVDVPLLMGYEMGNGKFHANVNAGVIVNAYSWQKGDVLDTTFQPINISTGKASSAYQFKTNIGMGFMAGASLYYKLNNKIHIMAEPYFRYNLSPMSKDILTLKQKYNTAGIKLGVRIDL